MCMQRPRTPALSGSPAAPASPVPLVQPVQQDRLWAGAAPQQRQQERQQLQVRIRLGAADVPLQRLASVQPGSAADDRLVSLHTL